jgi:hypothetical protein
MAIGTNEGSRRIRQIRVEQDETFKALYHPTRRKKGIDNYDDRC